MEAEERTVRQILTENIRYKIPAYQRPYSWEKENVNQLLEDVYEAAQNDEEEYFIGSLITIKDENNQHYDVVDGQQRLTTLNLILARLRDAFDAPEMKFALAERILPRDPLDDDIDEEAMPRLTLRKRDQDFFRRYVLDAREIPPTLVDEIKIRQDAPKRRIIENLEVIDKFIDSNGQETLKRFTKFLLTKVYVVFATTASFKSAYRLFNVLNARGIPLTNADLIKNSLFQQLGEKTERGSDVEESWLELEGRIGIERLDRFLGHHRSSVKAEKASESMYEEYKPLIERVETPFVFMKTLNASAENYLRILENKFEGAPLRAVFSLRRVGFLEWIPPLLAFMNAPVKGLPEREFIDFLERITYQNWIRGLFLTARLTVYHQLTRAINDGKSADDTLMVFKRNARNEDFLSVLNGDVYGKRFTKAVLLRIEEAAQDESVTKVYSGRITIEHILPQTLSGEYWLERFSESDHRNWVHRLGNLTLLSGSKNYSARNSDFKEKKRIYQNRDKKVSFDMTKEVIERFGEWNVDAIKARQCSMLKTAEDLWAIR